jgi:hypothetical protein
MIDIPTWARRLLGTVACRLSLSLLWLAFLINFNVPDVLFAFVTMFFRLSFAYAQP